MSMLPLVSMDTEIDQISSSTPAPENCFNPILSLPPDILTKILIQFPVKTLVQFRGVCTSWRAFISDPDFAMAHLKLAADDDDYAAQQRLILNPYNPRKGLRSCSISSLLQSISSPNNSNSITKHSLHYPLKQKKGPITLVGSVDGLVCLSMDQDLVYIWNPSIMQAKRLPHCDFGDKVLQYKRYGFGYDEASAQYKVMVMYQVLSMNTKQSPAAADYKVQVQIYGSKSHSWRMIDQTFPASTLPSDSAKFLNGSLHWAVSRWESIVSFDLSKETYSKIPVPYYEDDVSDYSSLGVLNGCLCMACDNICDMGADIWVMNKYGEENPWSNLFLIPYMNQSKCFTPVFISTMNEIFFMNWIRLECYNQNTVLNLNVHDCIEVDTYIESLVWPFEWVDEY